MQLEFYSYSKPKMLLSRGLQTNLNIKYIPASEHSLSGVL